MESLVTGYLKSVHRGHSFQSILHLIHIYRGNVFPSTPCCSS